MYIVSNPLVPRVQKTSLRNLSRPYHYSDIRGLMGYQNISACDLCKEKLGLLFVHNQRVTDCLCIKLYKSVENIRQGNMWSFFLYLYLAFNGTKYLAEYMHTCNHRSVFFSPLDNLKIDDFVNNKLVFGIIAFESVRYIYAFLCFVCVCLWGCVIVYVIVMN